MAVIAALIEFIQVKFLTKNWNTNIVKQSLIYPNFCVEIVEIVEKNTNIDEN